MARRKKNTKENENISFQVNENEKMPSFMHSLFDSDNKSGNPFNSNDK